VTVSAPSPDSQSLADDLALLREAAAEAGRIAMRYFGKSPEVWLKGGTSPVSEADIAVDRFLRETLLGARPDHGWLSEETADDLARLDARRTFVVDPIDGTRAFIDGRSTWCVSVAIVEAGRPLAGVLDCPAKGEVYSAALGNGASKNGVALAVRALGEAIDLGGPKSFVQDLPQHLRDRVRPAQYVPSLAYRIALVADGSLHGTFIKPNANDWDLAAADLILGEAGGAIVNGAGARPLYAGSDPRHGALAAGSGPLLDEMAATIARRRDD